MPPAPPQGIPAAGGDPDGDDDDAGGSSSHGTELSEEPEPEGWIARPITREAARGCHFHDALDTLLRQAFDRHTWSTEYRCVVYHHQAPQEEATLQQHLSPPPSMTIEQMFLMQTQAVQAIGQTLAAMQQVQQ
jgi:hypothetical protein